ncbi:MAG TPA: hypothetical protein VK572_16970, partial [Burkholderiales bacterium]|nr:hypothetical protein [Burkholderiales bacterium]
SPDSSFFPVKSRNRADYIPRLRRFRPVMPLTGVERRGHHAAGAIFAAPEAVEAKQKRRTS